jgi:hypothetical protein
MPDLENVKAGDKIFVSERFGAGRVVEVDRVTPTGRVITKVGEFNPNGRRRGDDGWSRTFARLASEDDIAGIYRSGLVSKIEGFRNWSRLTPEELKATAAIVDKHSAR